MSLPWIKMWLESLDDPKLTRLSLAERGAWWGILELAAKCDAGGKILSGGVGLNLDEIIDALHIKTSNDRQALESMVAKMEKRGSLKWNGNILTVVHWEKRQRVPLSSRPEAIAERVRRYRERRKKIGDDNVGQPLPEAGEGKEIPLVIGQEAARDSKEARGTLNEAGDEDVLAIWAEVKNFPRDSKEATRFLNKLRAEFPDINILEESRSWAAAKLSMPLTKQSLPFKQLRAWMMKAREFNKKPNPYQKEKQGERDYAAGKYGHMVRR